MSYSRILTLLISTLFLISCGSRKQLVQSYPEAQNIAAEEVLSNSNPSEVEFAPEFFEETKDFEEDIISKIIKYAKDFLGTGYKYGGTGQDGMDCSGLVHTAFSFENIQLPRTSREMATLGEKLDLEQVINGDLLFFRTDPRKKAINHVGLVLDMAEEGIYFIHSTTSKGVIISSLSEKYWQDHFVMARRIH